MERRKKKTPEQAALDELKEALGRAAIFADVYFGYTGSPVKAEIGMELKDDKWVHVPRLLNDGDKH